MKLDESKPHSVHLRLTEKQYEYCQANAFTMGVSVGDFIRMMINTMAVTTEKAAAAIKTATDNATTQLGNLEGTNHDYNQANHQ